MLKIPEQPKNSYRVTLELTAPGRMDAVLLEYLRAHSLNAELKVISRRAFKNLFKERRIQIKGQSAIPASGLAIGTTYVDILGFESSAGSPAESPLESSPT